MNRYFLVRLTAGLVVVVVVGLVVAQPPPPCETCPFYYTHRCNPHHNQGKFCVPDVKTKKKNFTVYCFKEIDYCYPKPPCCLRGCLTRLFPCLFPSEEFGCPHPHGCLGCGRVRTKRVLLKKSIPCEKLELKCRVEYLPCAAQSFDPTRTPIEAREEQRQAGPHSAAEGQPSSGPEAGGGKQDSKGSSEESELPPLLRKWRHGPD